MNPGDDDPGAAIKASRTAAGLTQAQLAERSGVRQPNIAAYERGTRRPTPAMVERLLQAARRRPSSVLDERRAEVRRVAGDHHARRIRLIGSAARGTDGLDSDLDFLVAFDDEATLVDHAALVHALEDLLGVPVDVVSERALRDRDSAILDDAVPV